MKIIEFQKNVPFNQISKNQGKVQHKYNQEKYQKFKEKNQSKLPAFTTKPSKYLILIRASSECLKLEREGKILNHHLIVRRNIKNSLAHYYI